MTALLIAAGWLCLAGYAVGDFAGWWDECPVPDWDGCECPRAVFAVACVVVAVISPVMVPIIVYNRLRKE